MDFIFHQNNLQVGNSKISLISKTYGYCFQTGFSEYKNLVIPCQETGSNVVIVVPFQNNTAEASSPYSRYSL
ncbi:MAG: hypothetical protein J6M05_00820 [Cardiobacteriaceae bacterium]|nr:hypothetical protein [Cardiobacteriaceae bacterium]